jgi:transposase
MAMAKEERGVYTDMEWWTRVRLEVSRERISKREILRREGIGWDTLKRILKHSEPPGYRLREPRPKPKIGAYLERIAQILEGDKTLPKKQRHTAKRIYERIREMGYGGKCTQVKGAVRELLRVKQEVFMPLMHRVGEAQGDFGYALAKVSGVFNLIFFRTGTGSFRRLPEDLTRFRKPASPRSRYAFTQR